MKRFRIKTAYRARALARRAMLFDNSPFVCVLFDDRFNAIDCNPEAIRCFGYADKAEFLANIDDIVTESTPFHERKRIGHIPLRQRLALAAKDGIHGLATQLFIQGKFLSFNCLFKRVAYGDTFVIAGYMVERMETEERLQLMLDAMPVSCAFINMRTYRAVDCNKALIELLGFSGKQEFIQHQMEIVPKLQPDGSESLAKLRSMIDQADRSGHSSSSFNYATALGGDLPVNLTFMRVDSGDERIVVGYMNDLRKLEKAQKELHMHARLLEAVNTLATNLIESGPDTFMETIDESLSILGHAVGVDRVYVWENFKKDDAAYCRQIYEWSEGAEPQQGKDFTVEMEYSLVPYWRDQMFSNQAINGPVSDLPAEEREALEPQDIKSVLVLPISLHGQPWGFIGFDDCRTIRRFSTVEEQVLQSGGILIVSSIERNRMTISLVEARESALASAKAKSDFLSRMSHEIRTPMNAIIGMTTLAQKSSDMERVQHYIKTVDSSSKQLLDIINDVLDMSKIDADKLEITNKEFDFEEMIRHIIGVLHVKMEEKKLDFHLNMPQVFARAVISDELRLSQVLINLLSNAIKFTPAGGKIILRLDEKPENNGRSLLRVEVEDSGIGIAQDQLRNVFRSFEQGDGSITRQYGGTGLGLAICKRIMSLMGGRIWVESELDKGSNFIVEVDIEWGGELGSKAERPPLKPDLHILVVDDAPDVLEYFKSTIESFSLSCDTALGGVEAVRTACRRMTEGTLYDIVFIDWNMPDMSGIETAREIKRIMGDSVIITLISVSDWSDIEQEARAADLGNFMPKPVLPSDLYNALVKHTNMPLAITETQEEEGPCNWSGQCILVVEDIEINREIIADLLEDTGVSIDNAENGREAVNMFKAAPDKYKLIFMDVQMPVLDGLSATREIRACGLPGCDTIPIVAMTANAFKEDEQESINAGMNAHISKPIDVSELFKALKDAFK